MKAITSDQLDQLKTHLIKKPFKYEEVFNEVLDHYASAYEQSNQVLEEVVAELDMAFTHQKIDQINKKYFRDLRYHLRKTYFSILAGNFRWPQLIYTLAYVTFFILALPILSQNERLFRAVFLIIACSPLLLGVSVYTTWGIRRLRNNIPLKNAHANLFGEAMPLSFIYTQIPNLIKTFFGIPFSLKYIQPEIIGLLLFIGSIILSSSVKMIATKIKPAIS